MSLVRRRTRWSATAFLLLVATTVSSCIDDPMNPERILRPADKASRSMAPAPGVTITPLRSGGVPNSAFARGINDAGLIVGTVMFCANASCIDLVPRGVTWLNSDVATELPAQTGVPVMVSDVNQSGVIVGSWQGWRVFTYSVGAFADLAMPGGDGSGIGVAINDNGVVLGLGGPSPHPFLWQNGVFTLPTPPPGKYWDLVDLNTSNDLVGSERDAVTSQRRPVRVRNGVGTLLPGFPGVSGNAVAMAINNHGQIAGAISKPNGSLAAAVWQVDNTMAEIPGPSGASECQAQAINDVGQVAVVCRVGVQHWDLYVWASGSLIYLGPSGQPSLSERTFSINNRSQVVGPSSPSGGSALWAFTANQPPVAVPGSAQTRLVNQPAFFNGSASSDPDGGALTFAWNFGDGQTATGATPQHAWSASGAYAVSLTVTDGQGASNTASTTVTVLNGSLAYGLPNTCDHQLTGVAFDGTYYYVAEGQFALNQCVTRYSASGDYLDHKVFSIDMRGLHYLPATGKLVTRHYNGLMYAIDYAAGTFQPLTAFVPAQEQVQTAPDPAGSLFWLVNGNNAEGRRLSDNALAQSFAVTTENPFVVAVSSSWLFTVQGTTANVYDKRSGAKHSTLTLPSSLGCYTGWGFGASWTGDRLLFVKACDRAGVFMTGLPQPPVPFAMDVQPATISLTSTSTVTAYLYSTAAFNATTTDPATVRLRVNGAGLPGAPVSTRSGAYLSSVGDYNNDGRQDRLFVFLRTDLQTAGLTAQRTSLTLEGAIGAFRFEAIDPTPPAVVGPVTANGPFAAVTVTTTAPPNNPGSTVSDIALAVSRVTPGGVITVLPGTYPTANLQINKPLTIKGGGLPRPILDGGGATSVLWINNVTQGAVTIQLLEFSGAEQDVTVLGAQTSTLITGNVFHPSEVNPADPANSQFRSGVSVFNTSGGGVVVENNTFLEGAVGVHGHAAHDLLARGNIFRGQSNRAIQVGGATGKAKIISNTITECPPIVCVAFYDGDAEVSGNQITVDMAFPVQTVIGGGGVRSFVSFNVINGQGGTMDPSNSSTWAITGAAIGFFRAQGATAVKNTVNRSYLGIWFDQSNGGGTDNVINQVHTPVGAWAVDGVNVTTASTFGFARNNITNYVEPLPPWIAQGVTAFPGSHFRCNWWGTPTGAPANMSPNVPAVLYASWAPAPIANTPTSCPQ